MNTPFNIGDDVWIAVVQVKEKRVTCPDCFGKKYLTVILGDDSTVHHKSKLEVCKLHSKDVETVKTT